MRSRDLVLSGCLVAVLKLGIADAIAGDHEALAWLRDDSRRDELARIVPGDVDTADVQRRIVEDVLLERAR